mgnify:FL=1
MDLNDFNENYLKPLLSKLQREHKKKIYILGDFNIDLLQADTHEASNSFLQEMEGNSLIPQITIPTRLTPRSKTLIDNIFTNSVHPKLE